MKTQLSGFIIRILIFSTFFSSVSVFWGFWFFGFFLPVTVCIEIRRTNNIARKFLTKIIARRKYSMKNQIKQYKSQILEPNLLVTSKFILVMLFGGTHLQKFWDCRLQLDEGYVETPMDEARVLQIPKIWSYCVRNFFRSVKLGSFHGWMETREKEG